MVSQSDVASLKWFEEHISQPDSDTKGLPPQSFFKEHPDAGVGSKMSTIEAQAQEVY